MRYLFFLILFLGCASTNNYIYWKTSKVASKKEKGVSLELPDYMLSGNLVGMKDKKLFFLKEQVPDIPQDFYLGYICKKTGFKAYPWEFFVKSKAKNIKIVDYYIDFDKKEVILNVMVDGKYKNFSKKFKSNYLKAYKDVFDEFVKCLSKNC